MKKLVKISSFILFSFVATLLIDRAIGLAIHHEEPVDKGLLFPPHSETSYKTIDFNYTASINGLGFRDHEYDLSNHANIRIVAIGDSFTYGWGVDLDQSWPKVLERNLRGKGLKVEVANLGFPGGSPTGYADASEKAIPLLKPDMVVIGILQGDDLAQLKPSTSQPTNAAKTTSNFRTRVSKVLHRLYPNLTTLAHNVNAKKERVNKSSVTSEWQDEAKQILAGFDPNERARYEALDNQVKQAFINGELNPFLIHSAIKYPDYFLQTFDLSKPEVQMLIDKLAEQLSRIKSVADQYKTKVVAVAVPFSLYVSHESYDVRRQYGFLLDKQMLVSDSPDMAIRIACEKAGIPFVTVTEDFRKHEDVNLFFHFDTHLNAAGHQFLGDELTPILEEQIKPSPNNKPEHSTFIEDKSAVGRLNSHRHRAS